MLPMEETTKRIRILFNPDDDVLTESQKSDGFNRTWLLLKPKQHRTIGDVSNHIIHCFKLQQSSPQGLILSKSGFVLPPFESTSILNDDDVIRVKKRNVLALEGSNVGQIEDVKQRQPVNNGVLLLANEEFVNEKEGYESDDAEDGDTMQDLDSKKRKRKEPEKLSGSKKKKQRSEAPGDVGDDVHIGKIESSSKGERRAKKKKILLEKEKESDSSSDDDVDNSERSEKSDIDLSAKKGKKKQRSEAPGDVRNDVHIGKIESSSKGECRAKKKKISFEKEKDSDSSSDDDVDNSEGSEKSDIDLSAEKRNVETQEDKGTENAKNAAVKTKKGPSRSARRKYAKRKWLKEMSKIQKLNATCESEGLKNWKEDRAKSEKNKYDKPKGPNWKKQRADPERMEECDEPKGLLHWKESHQNTMPVKGRKRQHENHVASFQKFHNEQGVVPQVLPSTETISKEAETIVKEAIQEQMDRLHQEKPHQNGDSREESNQDGGVHEHADTRNGDLTEKPNQQNCDSHRQSNEKDDVTEQSNQEDDGEKKIVPVVVRPGHIRFEPLEEDEAAQQNHVHVETFQWNGITSKKKGQKWGTEKYSFSPRNEYNNSNKDNSGPVAHKKVEQPSREIDFENLPPLTCAPKVGDLIAYRLLELSSCWTPELSEFRVGKVTWYNSKSTKTVLAPVPEYPIVSKPDIGEEDTVSDDSLYKEDGSLEIDFSALIGVRIINGGNTEPRNTVSAQVNEDPSKKENAPNQLCPTNPEQKLEQSAGNGGVDPWDEISLALNAKKDELTKESSWGKPMTPLVFRDTKNQLSPSNSRGKNSRNGQQSPANRWGKKVESRQPVKENSPSSKSWSYRALRGSALGPTMAMLRSKNDDA